MPKLRLAASFCFDLIDPKVNLLKAPGSLMIDVFIRNNFTSDSNAMVVGFLRDFADAESVLGNHTGAAALLAQADRVSQAMEELLWNGDDHYLTQRNPDNTTRDFVDYDANLIAVAHGIGGMEKMEKVLARVDSGRCSSHSGAGPQFVSERWYGPADTTHGNVGDSWTSMGRIAWFDAHARKQVGNDAALKAFDESTLGPLQKDLLELGPWMHERYGCDGKQQQNRTWGYFEYPVRFPASSLLSCQSQPHYTSHR